MAQGAEPILDRRKLKVKSAAGNVKVSHKWTISITIWAFILSVGISVLTSEAERVALPVALIMLFAIILLGILFDILGVAVSTASETPFHAMAAKKIAGARESIEIVRHAQQISSFCNDVIGDIAGIISGAMTAAVVISIVSLAHWNSTVVSLVLTGLVAALMIGGKAAGKGLAMLHNNTIVFIMGKIFHMAKGLLPYRTKKPRSKM